ncbi:MAG: hypothetical protein KDA20_00705 [Phycisphaerales bacterium]|nr:hypothetical protein [Phycisphaerales bacterium]
MLIKVVDTKNNDVWVNPLYVKSVTTKSGVTILRGSFGGSYNTSIIKTREDPQQLADRISAAMPDSPAWGAAATSALADEEAQRQAAAAAAAGG